MTALWVFSFMKPIIVPVTTSHYHGHISPESALAMFIVLNFICLVWLIVRYFVVDHIRELPFDSKYGYRNSVPFFVKLFGGLSGLNFPTVFLIMINGFALFYVLVAIVSVFIKEA